MLPTEAPAPQPQELLARPNIAPQPIERGAPYHVPLEGDGHVDINPADYGLDGNHRLHQVIYLSKRADTGRAPAVALVTVVDDAGGEHVRAIGLMPDPKAPGKLGLSPLPSYWGKSPGVDMTNEGDRIMVGSLGNKASVEQRRGVINNAQLFGESLPITVEDVHLSIERVSDGFVIVDRSRPTAGTSVLAAESVGAQGNIEARSGAAGADAARGLGATAVGNEMAGMVQDNTELAELLGLDARQQRIFAPLVDETSGSRGTSEQTADEGNYDWLFRDDYQPPVRDWRTERQSQNERLEHRDVESAVRRLFDLESGDREATAIIRQYTDSESGTRMPHEDIVGAIRSNRDLRYELAAHFLRVLKVTSADLPPRIARNEQKRPNYSGYGDMPNMTSREYAALLAISMLDGSFAYRDFSGDPVSRDEQIGQHRAAAFYLVHARQNVYDTHELHDWRIS